MTQNKFVVSRGCISPEPCDQERFEEILFVGSSDTLFSHEKRAALAT
jgi:hypothetical protein